MTGPDSGPEFGPGGYLPPKASQRARKIVLREQMGFGWPMAAVAAALLVAVAGGWYLLTAGRPPGPPYVALRPITEVDPSGAGILTAQDGRAVLVLRAGGTVRTFASEVEGIEWCPDSRRLETAGAAWTPDGRLVWGSGDSLQPLRSVVFDGIVYVDFTAEAPRLTPEPGQTPPACAG